eukprot:TRINITY_DN15455_c0_g1_i1.p1 TRINITY_DN15455_c0_g1~~TRINITY_DN15455_c0_g1_i1.p1  ORF type:complete len:470 (+),score=97.51 TRINITY_DN15455_c0_g1_i1:106-1515(+)
MSAELSTMASRASQRSTLEAENDLRHFLMVARPEWSSPKRRGKTNLSKVLTKLKAIGVSDTDKLVDRIYGNSINERLSASGRVELSRESIECIRKNTPFIRTLESTDIPHTRQVGSLAPMPQLLSKKRIAGSLRESRSTGSIGGCSSPSRGAASPIRPYDPASENASEGFDVDPSLYGLPGGEPFRLRLRGICTTKAKTNSGGGKRSSTAPAGARRPSLSGVSIAEESASASANKSDLEGVDFGNMWDETPKSTRSTRGRTPKGASSTWPANRSRSHAQSSAGGSPERVNEEAASTSKLVKLRTAPGGLDLATLGGFQSPTYEEVRRIQSAGATMRTEPLEARWSPLYWKSLTQHGEDMLAEQTSLDERNRLMRLVRCSGSDVSSMRTHVTENIRERLSSEQQRDETITLNIQQKCMNIKKQITSMANLRRDVLNLKSRMQAVTDDEELPPPDPLLADFGAQLGFGPRA